MAEAKTTTDHDTIREWAEARGGRPAVAKGTEGGEGAGVLRILFQDDDSLKEISWDEFFATFEEKKLAFLYQEEKDGQESRFFKLVDRDKNE